MPVTRQKFAYSEMQFLSVTSTRWPPLLIGGRLGLFVGLLFVGHGDSLSINLLFGQPICDRIRDSMSAVPPIGWRLAQV